VVVLKKRVSSEALGDGGSVEKQARAYLFYFFENYRNIFEAFSVFFKMNTTRKLGLHAQTLNTQTPAPGSAILFVGE
jgi:hypothetical protein